MRRREQELAEREIHILERELNIIIHQLYQEKPHVESRQGKFRRNRLKVKDGNRISLPSGTETKLCVIIRTNIHFNIYNIVISSTQRKFEFVCVALNKEVISLDLCPLDIVIRFSWY